MKRIMSLMLGLSLLSGMAVFAADAKDTTKKTGKSTKGTAKGKKKKATTTSTAPAPSK